MSGDEKALSVPTEWMRATDSEEALRVWLVRGVTSFRIRAVFDDPFLWGLVLVDIARQVANMHGDTDGTILNRILEGFRAELESPTDVASGRITSETDERDWEMTDL